MIAIAILAFATAAAILWSIFKYQTAYVALINALPPQFQAGLSSKFAFPEYVLRPSTPLETQADYVKSQVGSCFAALGIALLCFFYEKAVIGSIVLAVFLGYAALTIKSWKTYHSNRNRRSSRDDEVLL
jgi:hypothetical protein